MRKSISFKVMKDQNQNFGKATKPVIAEFVLYSVYTLSWILSKRLK